MATNKPAYRSSAEIGTYIREQREMLGVPLGEFAEHVGIDSDTLERIETGQRGLSVGDLTVIADGLGRSFQELLYVDASHDWLREQLSNPALPLEHRTALLWFETVIEDYFALQALVG